MLQGNQHLPMEKRCYHQRRQNQWQPQPATKQKNEIMDRYLKVEFSID